VKVFVKAYPNVRYVSWNGRKIEINQTALVYSRLAIFDDLGLLEKALAKHLKDVPIHWNF
jgi:hypothetical protein